ncbi:hypothetical protein HOD20_00590 [archaeon]|jgi:hypothetical protein|nr:hypothetical protein [archaeon]MBT4350999.1 hypothetical protein [archaeon]MBT4647921.1 hypothetical protein [archaeon]MBT7393155.1 hypothetical protein [archaeon]
MLDIVMDYGAIALGLLIALVLLVVGWVVSKIIASIFKRILVKGFKVEKILKQHKLDDALGQAKVTVILSKLVFWWVFVLFLGQAAQFIKLGVISDLLVSFIGWMPNLFYAVLTVVGGFIMADLVNEIIEASKIIWSGMIAKALKFTIMLFVLMTAFGQVGIDVSFVTDIFRILVSGLSLGFALAFGIAFGWGLKDETPKILNAIKNEMKKTE